MHIFSNANDVPFESAVPSISSWSGKVDKKKQVASRLLSPTASITHKKQSKKVLSPLAPFRAGGGMRSRSEITNRRLLPGIHDSLYDSAVLEERETDTDRRERFLYGPFVPASTKSTWQTLAPLSYRRLPPTVEVKSMPAKLFRRRAIHSAPHPQTASSDLSDNFGDFTSLSDSRPTTVSSAGMAGRGVKGSIFVTSQEGFDKSPSSTSGIGADAMASNMTPQEKDKSRKGSIMSTPRSRTESEESPRDRAADLLGSNVFSNPKKPQDETDTDEQKVFRRFQDDNTVHIEDLGKILRALGYVIIHEEWFPGILKPITSYSQLTIDKYLSFLESYKETQRSKYREDFDRVDEDGGGTLDKDELAGLLHSWGIWPMAHILEEALYEVNPSGNLEFDEFEKVVNILVSRQCHSQEEYREIMAIFKAFDRNKSASILTSDVKIALDWLGFAMSPDQVETIIEEVDVDKGGTLDELEWLECMRKVREIKVLELQATVAASDVDGDGNIQFNELLPMLCSMGYFPDDQAVREAAKDAGIAEDDEDLDISELWRFMKVYRDREGLNMHEVQEIEDGFRHCGIPLDGEVSAVQVGGAVRSIGYMLSFDKLQNLVNKVDINGSGELDQREFRKMVRLINQQDLDTICLGFQQATESRDEFHSGMKPDFSHEDPSQYRARIPGEDASLTVRQALKALERLGCVDHNGNVAPLLPCDKVDANEVDVFGFCTAARRSRQTARAAFRENGGFNKEEIQVMKERFREFDDDDSGELDGHEIIKVLEVHFPTLANDASRRPLILQLLKEADEDGSGTLDFGDFLRLMRQVKDIQDQLMIAKELRAVEETGFTPSEVSEFRELLLAVRGEASEIGFEEIQMLLGAIVPMGAKNLLELRKKYNEVASRHNSADSSTDKLDFPEFLWLMRGLLDMNFANMAERAQEMQENTNQEKK